MKSKCINKLESALNKACLELVRLSTEEFSCKKHCPVGNPRMCDGECSFTDVWMEWCMKDE